MLRHGALKQPANRRGHPHVHRDDTKFAVAIDRLNIKINVVHSHHFAVIDVNNLLIEYVMIDADQTLIQGIAAKLIARHVGLDGAHGDGLNLRISNALEGLMGRPHQIRSHTRALAAGVDAQILYLPQELAFYSVHWNVLYFREVNHRPPPPRPHEPGSFPPQETAVNAQDNALLP